MKIVETLDSREHILDVAQKIIAAKGYSAVGLSEILSAAEVPKGSFYYYFKSKDAFGEALLQRFFERYLVQLDKILGGPGNNEVERLLSYWQYWQDTQKSNEFQGKCLTVKLSGEVVDLSESMRLALQKGTADIISRLSEAIDFGVKEKSIKIQEDSLTTARTLYQLWLGASLMVKITHSADPFQNAMITTRQILGLKS